MKPTTKRYVIYVCHLYKYVYISPLIPTEQFISDGDISMNIGVTSAPVITSQYIESYHKLQCIPLHYFCLASIYMVDDDAQYQLLLYMLGYLCAEFYLLF